MIKMLTADYQTLPPLLVEARQAAGLLQAQVANQLNKPQSFVSKYESGDRRLDVIELLGILKVLGVDSREFVAMLQTQLDQHRRTL